MFDKLAPTLITNTKHRILLVVAMVWFFAGAWIDSSAHTYLLDDLETFFTPWHAVLYSGYAFSVFVALYVKNGDYIGPKGSRTAIKGDPKVIDKNTVSESDIGNFRSLVKAELGLEHF